MKTATYNSNLTLILCLLGLATSVVVQEFKPMENKTLIRTLARETPFKEFASGAQVYYLYGGMGMGVPSSQIGAIAPNTTFPLHAHTNDYYAVIVSGNFQHWEEGDVDEGPVMTAGSSYFQAGGVPHYDRCVGPEKCVMVVTFKESADFYPVEEKENKNRKN